MVHLFTKFKFKKLKLKKAKFYDADYLTKLFAPTYKGTDRKKIDKWIKNKQIYVLKYRGNKRIKAAFTYSIFGIIGIFSIMYIHKVSVAPDFQGNGIGTLLMSRIKSKSAKIGVSVFILYSWKHVVKFYKKNKLHNIWRFFWWRKV